MADRKKMSVAEILAAARKTDSAGNGPDRRAVPAGGDSPTEGADTPGSAAGAAPAAASSDQSKPAAAPAQGAAGAGPRPSVADILAQARAKKKAAAAPAAGAGPQAAASRPATAAKPARAAAPTAKVMPAGPKTTASILAAARKTAKPGPVSKAQAQMTGRVAPAKSKRPRIEVPPLPTRPAAVVARPAPVTKPGIGRRAFAYGMFAGSFLAMGFLSLATTLVLWTLGLARFMFPNVLREPPSQFKVGFPADFAPGQVETKFKAQFGIWVVNGQYKGRAQIYALRSVCTHLGCTPNWLEAEQKFKCPCHGSGFYKDGINFEGPAPRPLERYAIRVADDGQLEIDKSKTFHEEMGQWEDPASYVPV